MTSILYILATVLIISWLLVAFVFSTGSSIYVLLLPAFIAAFEGIFSRRPEF